MNKTKDCRNCVYWITCPCGKSGHDKGTSIGYSIGECKRYKESTKKMKKIDTAIFILGSIIFYIVLMLAIGLSIR